MRRNEDAADDNDTWRVVDSDVVDTDVEELA
jgi:hypothetical protein